MHTAKEIFEQSMLFAATNEYQESLDVFEGDLIEDCMNSINQAAKAGRIQTRFSHKDHEKSELIQKLTELGYTVIIVDDHTMNINWYSDPLLIK